MGLKLFETMDFSESISVTKSLPLFQKILDGLDVELLLSEMNSFISDDKKYADNAPWFSIYDIDVASSKQQLLDIGLLNYYQQYQMTQSQIEVPWQNWRDGIGDYTKSVFNDSLPGFHRPRYVVAGPGWQVSNHTDWGSNSQLGLRFHLLLQTNDQCVHYATGDDNIEQSVAFQPGEVWFYNVEKTHRAENLGSAIRKSISFELFNDDLI